MSWSLKNLFVHINLLEVLLNFKLCFGKDNNIVFRQMTSKKTHQLRKTKFQLSTFSYQTFLGKFSQRISTFAETKFWSLSKMKIMAKQISRLNSVPRRHSTGRAPPGCRSTRRPSGRWWDARPRSWRWRSRGPARTPGCPAPGASRGLPSSPRRTDRCLWKSSGRESCL